MASKTKRTSFIRKRKMTKMGKRRKASDRTRGSTLSQKELFGDK